MISLRTCAFQNKLLSANLELPIYCLRTLRYTALDEKLADLVIVEHRSIRIENNVLADSSSICQFTGADYFLDNRPIFC